MHLNNFAKMCFHELRINENKNTNYSFNVMLYSLKVKTILDKAFV